MEKNVIEAVGFAHKPGRNTIKADINRLLKRAFIWLLFRRQIPLAFRQRAMFGVMQIGSWLYGRPWAIIAGASKGNTFENDVLKLVFNATNISLIADNTATTPLTNIFVALHTSDPGEAGDQTTNEIAYTGYGRVSVARTTGGWTASSSGSTSPVANIDFGQMTAGVGGTVTHFSCGTLTSGAGKILYSGTVTPNISVVDGVIPRLTTASTITED